MIKVFGNDRPFGRARALLARGARSTARPALSRLPGLAPQPSVERRPHSALHQPARGRGRLLVLPLLLCLALFLPSAPERELAAARTGVNRPAPAGGAAWPAEGVGRLAASQAPGLLALLAESAAVTPAPGAPAQAIPPLIVARLGVFTSESDYLPLYAYTFDTPVMRLTGAVSEYVEDRALDGRFDYLAIDVGVEVFDSYGLTARAELRDASGRVVGSDAFDPYAEMHWCGGHIARSITYGKQMVGFHFKGQDLIAYGRGASFTFHVEFLRDGVVVAEGRSQTWFYRPEQFEEFAGLVNLLTLDKTRRVYAAENAHIMRVS